jgi:hypothetical protein
MPDPEKTHEDEDRKRRYEKHKVDKDRSVGSPGIGGGTGGTADPGVDGGEGIPGSANVPQSGLEETARSWGGGLGEGEGDGRDDDKPEDEVEEDATRGPAAR